MKAAMMGSLLMVIGGGLAALEAASLQDVDEPVSIEVRPASVTLRVGEKATLEAVVKKSGGCRA